MRVGFLGAGRMGRPMVERLVRAGHEVCALGRSLDARRALTEIGAQAVSAPAAVGTNADLVIVCVFTDEQVRAVCLGTPLLAAMPSGSTLVLHTTGSPHTAAAIAAEAVASHGIQVLDAPVSGGPPDIAAGRLTLFVGGPVETVDRVRPVLAAYGDPILHVGPLGAGQRVKLVNNAVFAAQLGILTAAVDLGKQLGVAETTLLAALPHGSAASRALTGVAGRGSVAEFSASVGEFVGKDVAAVRSIAAELGTDLGLLDDAIDNRH
ncbi:NAD(P)-dependent oxidoreductase [Nocardia vinacea]|uniref:NAD(P)-dependent oxidoreductase n=1 Tax=Nocardia vinacea TaxID=96468 RepID=UPI000593C698|nr:NAD(P)-dependent oxidoreductase [Nocardia vinacea]